MTDNSQGPTDPTGSSPDFWKGKRILIVSPEAWGPVRLSKHHYASTLMEQGAQIFFLGPDTPNGNGIRIIAGEGDQPTLLFRPPPIRGIRFLPRTVRAWLEAFQMRQLANTAGGAFDILWNFDLYRFRSLTSRQDAKLRIVHVMDLRHQAHLSEPAKLADLIIVVSPSMANVLDQNRDRVLRVPHGWLPRKRNDEKVPELPPGIKMGYLGNLAMRAIHWESLIEIATRWPEVQLFLMGPLHGAFGDHRHMETALERTLRSIPNIHLTGPLPYDDVPAWLESMDALLISYDLEREGLKSTSSHKLLEYLASGKVVLSSYLEDHTDLNELMIMAKPNEHIVPYFEDLVRNLDAYNSPDLQARRKAKAEENSYAGKLLIIMRALRPMARR